MLEANAITEKPAKRAILILKWLHQTGRSCSKLQGKMEDPFAAQQEALLRRITNSAERLAEVMEEVNGELAHAEKSYARIEQAHAVWKLYESKMDTVVREEGKARNSQR